MEFSYCTHARPQIYGYEIIKEETNKRKREALALLNSQPLNKVYQLQKSKAGAYICPICGSGTGRNHTGALTISSNNCVTCFASNCFEHSTPKGIAQGTDTAGALCKILNIELDEVIEAYTGFNWRQTFREIKRELYETGEIKHKAAILKESGQPVKEIIEKAPEPEIRRDYMDFILKCHEALKRTPAALEYLYKRGLNKKTIKTNHLGFYIDKYNHGYIVLPYTGGFYFILRRIKTDEPGKKYRKPKASEAGREPLHHPEYLINRDPVIICEGYFDALSIEQAGAVRAIPLNTTGAPTAFIKAIEEVDSKTPLILSLDNDKKDDGRNPGQEGQKRLVEYLKERNKPKIKQPFIEWNLSGDCKDANELLVKDPDQLKANIEAALKELDKLINTMSKEQRAENGT